MIKRAPPDDLYDELNHAIEELRADPARAAQRLESLAEVLREDAPVPIYGAPVDNDVVMAYGGPPVYQPSERVKRWNRDHDHHPYREIQLVSQLSSQGLSADQIDAVLDVLDDICTSCWDAPAKCQCWNDR